MAQASVILVAAVATSACSSSRPAARGLRTPSELVTIGFRRSRVVMLNDIHNGALRLVRARKVAASVLPAARTAGVRFFAMEALTPQFAADANRTRAVPAAPDPSDYLAQPEMRDLIATALARGMTLVAYDTQPADRPPALRGLPGADPAYVDWRERTQASRLDAFLRSQRPGTKLLVFPGNGHLGKQGSPSFTPMGVYFQTMSGIEPFSIDQGVTSNLEPATWRGLTTAAKTTLASMQNRSGGYLRTEDPNPARRSREDVDAFIVSRDNNLE